jgi:predicted nucleotidyltransferase
MNRIVFFNSGLCSLKLRAVTPDFADVPPWLRICCTQNKQSTRRPKMVNKNKILEVLKNNKQYMQTNFMINSIGLFGSYARDDFHDTSDIDILVTFSEPTFDHYMDLKFYLEDIFGRQVDVVMEKTVKQRLKKTILQETLYV